MDLSTCCASMRHQIQASNHHIEKPSAATCASDPGIGWQRWVDSGNLLGPHLNVRGGPVPSGFHMHTRTHTCTPRCMSHTRIKQFEEVRFSEGWSNGSVSKEPGMKV